MITLPNWLNKFRKQTSGAGGGGGGGGTPFITSLTGSAAAAFNGKIGHKINGSSATIVALGGYMISGNSQTHVLRLWDAGSGGTQCGLSFELANTTINFSGQTANTFVYGTITPVTLNPANEYWIYMDITSGGDQYLDDTGSVSTNAAATLIFSAYNDGACHVNNASKSYGVNWKS